MRGARRVVTGGEVSTCYSRGGSDRSNGFIVQLMLPGALYAHTSLDNRDGPYLVMPQVGLKLLPLSFPDPSKEKTK